MVAALNALDIVVVLVGLVAVGMAAFAGSLSQRLRAELDAAVAARREAEAVLEQAVIRLGEIENRMTSAAGRLDDAVDEARLAADVIDRRAKGAYRAIAEPVIKGAAVASGSRRVIARLRHPDAE